MTFYLTFLMLAIGVQLLLSSWPGALVGVGVFLMLLGGTIGYKAMEGTILRVRKPILFIILLFIFWGSPLLFFFTDITGLIKGCLYDFPEARMLLPLGVCTVFGYLYLYPCKICNGFLARQDWLVVFVFWGLYAMIFVSQFIMFFYAFYSDRWGRIFAAITCIVYSILMLMSFKPFAMPLKQCHWKHFLIDVITVFFYHAIFRTSYLVSLAFVFLLTFFQCKGEKRIRAICLIFCHVALIMMPGLAFYFQSDAIWHEAQSFRVNSIKSLVVYEFFAVFYAIVTVLRACGKNEHPSVNDNRE